MKATPARSLERGASADLWRNTLSRIASLFGRLVYLSSLRNPNSGRYEHYGLAQIFGATEADPAMRNSHTQTFSEWLYLPLEHQKADLDLYLSSLEEPRKVVIENWSRLALYRTFMPLTAKNTDRELYLTNIEALLAILRNGHGPARSDRFA